MDDAKPRPPTVHILWVAAMRARETPEQRELRAARERAINNATRQLNQYSRYLKKGPPCAPPASPPPDSSS